MPSLKAIRKRIASVKNTKKITAAMKLVAGARLRRSQDAVVASRPYADRLRDVIGEVAARAGAEAHPLLIPREPRKVAVLMLTSDRGLCGGFNSNINRRVERFIVDTNDRTAAYQLNIVGKKGREYFRRRKNAAVTIPREWPAPATGPAAQAEARTIASELVAEYLAGDIDGVVLVYNKFLSAISQSVEVEPLLPVAPAPIDASGDFKYEPSKEQLLSHLIPLHIEAQIYRALLESIASEFGARMSAMDSATRNASDMIGRLTLEFNRARQAAITRELMEIIGGAEALKG